ncbi:uncharacterized protein LOC119307362 [Triticum dicoccoides]|uniref:DUF538 domain-containing protein n=1 Tax=Triticum aestivum TaxID=4565 RepID=A0A3B5YZ40_WHEAT|nr:uncharacterized protein LOC119307362 [Triticum dicoccoides]XP_044370905.1 uncharacterized protein LOC123093074 [Triticum aestivum]
MATTRLGLLLLLFTLLAGTAVFSVSAARNVPAETVVADPVGAEPSAYEMLEKFGFPKGILPVGVTGYTLRRSDGAFQVFMDKDCEFEVDGGYKLTYKQTISGRVAGGSLWDLRGVSVKIFFVNWGIDQVLMADADHLMFYVGPLSQAFTSDNFEESPQCRCRGHGVADVGEGAGVGVAAM